MKKSKLSASLITGFVAALSLAACNEVTADNNHIVTYKDYSTGEVSVNIDSFYDSYRFTSSGLSTIYDAVIESIVRYEFQSLRMDGKTDKTMAELKESASNKVKGKKEEAQKNAETNKTSYETEWNNILSSNDCEDENELYEKFLYELEKTEVEDWYLKENYKLADAKKSLINEFIGVSDLGASTKKKVEPAYPYHIRHILASIADSSTNFSNNVITQQESEDLWEIVNMLSDVDYSFGEIARRKSGDSGSAAEYGDMGIMTTSSSYIEEFKLAIYAFDAIYNDEHAGNNAVIQNGLGINANRKGQDNLLGAKTIGQTFQSDIGLAAVPYRAFAVIGDSADLVKDENGYVVNEDNAAYYPRNIYWNKYCNLHQPFVITDDELTNTDAQLVAAGLLKDETAASFASTFANTRFVSSVTLGLDEYIGNCKVLVGNQNRVIIGARGSYGIHFMIMQKSIYDYKEGGTSTQDVSLEEYYTPFIPGDANYPKYVSQSKYYDKENTFIDYYSTSDTSVYTARANKVKDALKEFDSTYNYRLYLDFIGEAGVTFTFNGVEDKNLGTRIADMINTKQLNNVSNREKDLQSSWTTYIERIELQESDRVEAIISGSKATNEFRLIPEGCAIGYKGAEKGAEWAEGGYCYYAK